VYVIVNVLVNLFFLNSVHELHCALPLPLVVKRNGKFSEIYRDELQ
jgi:hypothetical protein